MKAVFLYNGATPLHKPHILVWVFMCSLKKIINAYFFPSVMDPT